MTDVPYSSPICQTGSCMLDSHRAAHVLAKLQLLCFHYKNGRICSSCLCLDQTTSWLFILKSRYWIQRWHIFNPIRIACQGHTPKKFSSFQAHLVLTHPIQYAQYFFYAVKVRLQQMCLLKMTPDMNDWLHSICAYRNFNSKNLIRQYWEFAV